MSVAELVETVRISMEIPCDHRFCSDHALKLYDQLNTPHYSTGASVMRCPATVEEWQAEHRTARRAAMKAVRDGYTFAEVDYSKHSDDIHAINVSRERRQGRPMSAGYLTRIERRPLSEDQTRCPRHRTHTYGVLSGRTLVAYLTLHRAGELGMVSTIIGHGEHEDRSPMMFLLVQGMIADQAPQTGTYYYNLHRSGDDGLRFKKARYGFRPADIEWSLS